MIETSSVPPRKSLEILCNLRKISEKCSEMFALPSEQFWKIFGNLWKVVGNLQKIVKNVVISMFMYNKQNITCPLVDINFIFECSTRYLTSEHSERVRCRVEHLKIKFISTHGHVISAISLILGSISAGLPSAVY